MENKKFDNFIKQALENLDGENYIPSDWSAMEGKMDAEANGFDQFVQQSVENLDGAKFVPMDWSLMEGKLDAEVGADAAADAEVDPQMEDIYLDAVAYDHLNNIERPYNKEHWKIMSARLDEEYAYRRRVIITKSLEAAIVLLLVWTAINFFPNKKTQSTNEPLPIATLPSSNHINTNNPNLQTDQHFSTSVITTTNQDSNASEENTNTESFTSPQANAVQTEAIHNNTITFQETIPPSIVDRPVTEEISPLSNSSTLLLATREIENSSSIFNEEKSSSLLNSEKSVLEEKLLVQISPISSLGTSLLAIHPNHKNNSEHPDFFKDFFNKRKLRTHRVFFSMYSSGDLNIVQSDFYNTAIREWDVYQRDRSGYGAGFALSFELKRLAVEIGASYNFVSYKQREESNLIGSFAEGYLVEQWEDAELNMVQIPLNIQYSFLKRNKWRMYSVTGVSLNMAAQNNFNFQLEDKTTATRSPRAEQSMIANEAIAYQGILEGGSFKENSYFTADLGFGLERRFTYRWSLFVQPTYRHYFLFEGIGPNKDIIHSGSVRFGARVKIR